MVGRKAILDLSDQAGVKKPKRAPQLWMGHMTLASKELKDDFAAELEEYKAQFEDYDASVKRKEAQHVMARRVQFWTKSFEEADEETQDKVREFCKTGYLQSDLVVDEISAEYTRLENIQA